VHLKCYPETEYGATCIPALEEIVSDSAKASASHSPVALACDARALDPVTRTRHFIWIRYQLPRLVKAVTELPDGVELKFAAADLEPVASFIERERRCCPFLRFELELVPDEEVLWLRLTGPEGVKRFLGAELLASPPKG
jgi:hypothetical protein